MVGGYVKGVAAAAAAAAAALSPPVRFLAVIKKKR